MCASLFHRAGECTLSIRHYFCCCCCPSRRFAPFFLFFFNEALLIGLRHIPYWIFPSRCNLHRAACNSPPRLLYTRAGLHCPRAYIDYFRLYIYICMSGVYTRARSGCPLVALCSSGCWLPVSCGGLCLGVIHIALHVIIMCYAVARFLPAKPTAMLPLNSLVVMRPLLWLIRTCHPTALWLCVLLATTNFTLSLSLYLKNSIYMVLSMTGLIDYRLEIQ